MARISIVKTGIAIDINFGSYGDGDHTPFETNHSSSNIVEIAMFDEYVSVTISGSPTLYLCYTITNSYLVVDTINGVIPTSNADLYSKLKALR